MAGHFNDITCRGARILMAAIVALPFFAQTSGANWLYEQNKDEMRGTTVSFASVASDNGIQLSSTATPTKLWLTLRSKNPKDLDVYFTVNDGHFVCFDGTTIAVKFDNGPVENYKCDNPSDGGTQQVFLMGSFDFFAKLKRSRKVIIEPLFYGDGRNQFTFTTIGLGWT